MTDKEYGFDIAKNLFVDMTMCDIHKYADEKKLRQIFTGTLPFQEAESIVKAWREDRTSE